MLLWFEADSTTELAVLHLESFGNPRRFARTARRIGTRVPILTVHAGRSAPDQRAAISHTAAAAAPPITRQARSSRRASSQPPASANCWTWPC